MAIPTTIAGRAVDQAGSKLATALAKLEGAANAEPARRALQTALVALRLAQFEVQAGGAKPATLGSWSRDRRDPDEWVGGSVAVDGKAYRLMAKVYDGPSEFGLLNGRTSKLTVWAVGPGDQRSVLVEYDRGWGDDGPPGEIHVAKVVGAIVAALETLPPVPAR